MHEQQGRGTTAFYSGAKGRAFESRRAYHPNLGIYNDLIQILALMTLESFLRMFPFCFRLTSSRRQNSPLDWTPER